MASSLLVGVSRRNSFSPYHRLKQCARGGKSYVTSNESNTHCGKLVESLLVAVGTSAGNLRRSFICWEKEFGRSETGLKQIRLKEDVTPSNN